MHPVRPEIVPAVVAAVPRHVPTAVPATVRDRFPGLADPSVVYLDSAATTQKPDTVIAAVTDYHRRHTANPGRGTYSWATTLSARIAAIRSRTAAFVGAGHPDEIVFTAGATAALNAVALAWGLTALADGDEILYSPADHAANVLPWEHLRDTLARFGRRIALRPYRVTGAGEADTDHIAELAGPRTRLITVSHLHHVYGGLSTLEELRGRLDPGVLLCFDCSQSGGHLPVDVTALGADFAVFAGHKMFGAPGTGVLYCRRRVHGALRPFLPGGHTGTRMPELLEGGTYNVPGILSLAPALDLLDELDLTAVAAHNRDLTLRLIEGLRRIPGVRFLPGPAGAGCAVGYGIVSFTLDGITATDLGFVLAEHGFLVRTGAHCVPGADESAGSVRVSTHVYTTPDEIDRFLTCLRRIAAQLR
ncbi:aminotransferase class V-fold PLP-dependent enzyme [Nocardia thailandica]|uniref:aminotransferase class V-fold PLP-dependent enzyme n=1 Tax=Nocardia thailandica TaxID=257275 RepID=UPI00030BD7C6|nr:aminotransferase class V-fold PLP-dependent enzyme [Nocardia thailandica]